MHHYCDERKRLIRHHVYLHDDICKNFSLFSCWHREGSYKLRHMFIIFICFPDTPPSFASPMNALTISDQTAVGSDFFNASFTDIDLYDFVILSLAGNSSSYFDFDASYGTYIYVTSYIRCGFVCVTIFSNLHVCVVPCLLEEI